MNILVQCFKKSWYLGATEIIPSKNYEIDAFVGKFPITININTSDHNFSINYSNKHVNVMHFSTHAKGSNFSLLNTMML